jgi:hypothetical protein
VRVSFYVGQATSAETPTSCAQLVQELRGQGSSTVADYLEGVAVYDPDYISELNALTSADPVQRLRVDACVQLRSTQVQSAAAAGLTAEEAEALAAYEQAKLAEATAGKAGATGYVGPGQALSSAGAKAAYAQAQAKLDAQGDPLGWIKGSYQPFGISIPKWAVWAGVAWVTYTAVTGYATGKART